MRVAVSGGQYSLFRAVFGIYLLVHFAQLVPYGAELFSSAGMLPDAALSPLVRAFPNLLAVWDAPWLVTGMLCAGVALSALLALGAGDRAAAVALWYLGACLYGRNPLIANPALPYIGWLLLAHALVPKAPLGSWRARGRADPGGGWQLPRGLFTAAWIVLAVGYTYSGLTKLGSPSWIDGSALRHVLENPLARPTLLRDALLALPDGVLALASWGTLALEVGFAPLACVRRLRPLLWTALLGMHLGIIVCIDFADLSLGMVMMHLFTFDARWLPARAARTRGIVFFDGQCGLCHAWVRFALAEAPDAFDFAPLGGRTFREKLPAARSDALPDSLVLLRDDGELRLRSDAVIDVLRAIGGAWRALAEALALVPRPLRDAVYARVASWRRHARPETACPRVPPHLAERLAP